MGVRSVSQRVLFVGHSGHRSGAPIIMLEFLRWLKSRADYELGVMLLVGGPLVADFERVAPTEVLDRPLRTSKRLVRRIVGARRFELMEDQAFVRRLARARYDVAYVNTVVPKREILALASAGVPIVCHVHELGFAIDQWLGPEGITPLIEPVSHFVASSAAVRDNLVRRWAVPESKVTMVHEFTTAMNQVIDPQARGRIRSSLGVGDRDILVGGCGTLDWRKGADLFLQVAKSVVRADESRAIHFVWLGAERGSPGYREFMYDLERSSLTERVSVLESTSRPGEVFAGMDVFALTSREDPFPLVMLEAAALRVPMVCFAESGGGPEFAEGGTGLVVPYLDTDAFADRVLSLAADAGPRHAIGGMAAQKVADRFTIDHQAPKLHDVMRKCI